MSIRLICLGVISAGAFGTDSPTAAPTPCTGGNKQKVRGYCREAHFRTQTSRSKTRTKQRPMFYVKKQILMISDSQCFVVLCFLLLPCLLGFLSAWVIL
jgi:hypothetical protein